MKDQEALAKSLAESEGFAQSKEERKGYAQDQQDEVAMNLGTLIASIGKVPENRASILTQLETMADNAAHDQRHSSDPKCARMPLPAISFSAFAYAVETGQQEMLKKDYLSAREMFQVGEIIQPDSAWATYLSATAYAALGEKKPAIQKLKKAMNKGLSNPKSLEDPAFDRIRNEEAFKQIAASLSSNPKQETGK